jgi:hypothetical protein
MISAVMISAAMTATAGRQDRIVGLRATSLN